MVSGAARYDGHSEWYDQYFGPGHRPPAEELAFLREALGTGHGQVCVELACGTGLWAQPIAEAGYRAAGFDISADQLRFARRRLASVARADACLLPVRDESVPVMVGMFFHTDLLARGERRPRLRHDAGVATLAGRLRTPFARYWLSGFLADFGDAWAGRGSAGGC